MVTHCCSIHAIPLSNSPTTAPHLHTSFATLPHSHTQPFTFHSLSHLSPILPLPLLSPHLSPPPHPFSRPLAPSSSRDKKRVPPSKGSTHNIFCDVVP